MAAPAINCPYPRRDIEGRVTSLGARGSRLRRIAATHRCDRTALNRGCAPANCDACRSASGGSRCRALRLLRTADDSTRVQILDPGIELAILWSHLDDLTVDAVAMPGLAHELYRLCRYRW